MYEKQWEGSAIPDVDRLMLFHIEIEELIGRGKYDEARRFYEGVKSAHIDRGYDSVEFLDLLFLSGEQLGRERAELARLPGGSDG
jgi:hypothetical protein